MLDSVKSTPLKSERLSSEASPIPPRSPCHQPHFLPDLSVNHPVLCRAIGAVAIVRDNLAICGYFSMISYYIALWAPTFIFTFFFGWRGFFCGVVCVMSSKSLEQCRKVMEKCSDY